MSDRPGPIAASETAREGRVDPDFLYSRGLLKALQLLAIPDTTQRTR
jgi:hypothetical protein